MPRTTVTPSTHLKKNYNKLSATTLRNNLVLRGQEMAGGDPSHGELAS